MKELETHYDLLAENYARIHPLRHAIVDFIVDKIISSQELKPFGHIVDFGCGSGELLKELSGKLSFPDLLCGVDLSASMVKKARAKGLNIINSNFEKVYFDKGAVFLGIFQESIHHANFELLGANLERIMNSQGKLIVFYQEDWTIEPVPESMIPFIEQARLKRTGPSHIIEQLANHDWVLSQTSYITDRYKIDVEFIKDALTYNALSYWSAYSKEEKQKCLDEIYQNERKSDLHLLRKVRAMVFTRGIVH
jgi:SAM-dependent methyltransferase